MTGETNRTWLWPCAAIVGVEFLAASFAGPLSAINFGAHLVLGLVAGVSAMVVAVLVRLVGLWRAGEQRPGPIILRALPWSLLAAAMLVLLQIAVLNLTKHMLPLTVGFFADPALAAFDRRLLGTDAWRLSYALFGWATPLLDQAYILWSPVKAVALVAVAMLPPGPRKAQAMIAYFLCFAVGCFGQYLGASAGPIFYGPLGLGDEFRDLPVLHWAGVARDYLLSDMINGSKALGTGISAMPSMHVTLALWVALVVRAFAPRFQPLGWLFFALTTIGSVHLGWHYASDAVAGWLIALAAWFIAPVLARATDRLGSLRAGCPAVSPA